ncbi:MAG TPA: DUF4097 family beta strand repeat-containing protein [Thermoanaerobaculia bacterium]|jgi:DUF4097 and DUF4098 domain-containing protein YvlB
MRRLGLGLALILSAGSLLAHDGGHGDITADCSPRHYQFGRDRQSVVQREEIPARGLRSLKVTAENGPVSVKGGNEYSIVVCKAAEDEAALRDVRVSLRGNELSAEGPSDGRWTVAYQITVPRGAELDVQTENGPIAMREIDGRVTAHATNGPISIKDIRGDVDAKTTNGPISITGRGGNVKAIASNGPVSVKLEGESWGGSLEARTSNGPLSVKVPRGYATGVVIETDGHGPVSCNFDGCDEVRRAQREGRHRDAQRFELGSGPRNVRLSTSNGPLTIREE